jgi:hypothetical protein
VVFPNGVTGIATNTYIFPSIVKIGDSGNGTIFDYSDGTVHTSAWQATDGGNGNIVITNNLFANGVLQQQNIDTINPKGITIAIEKNINDFPFQGVITTLYCNKI